MSGERAPAGADLEHAGSLANAALLERPIKFPLQRFRQRLVVTLIDALAIGGKNRIEKTQKEIWIGVVVRGDRPLVGVNLTEQQRLEEAPGRDQRMRVVKRLAKVEGLQHVALKIDIAVDIGFGDIALIERAHGAQSALIPEPDHEGRLAGADLTALARWQFDREGGVDRSNPLDQGVNRGRCSCHISVLTSVVPVVCRNSATEATRRKWLTESKQSPQSPCWASRSPGPWPA